MHIEGISLKIPRCVLVYFCNFSDVIKWKFNCEIPTFKQIFFKCTQIVGDSREPLFKSQEFIKLSTSESTVFQ